MSLVRSMSSRIRRAVVTGGAGFLGSHLCEALVTEGVEVVCLDNFLTGGPENVSHLLSDPRFRLVRCDVTDFVHVSGNVDLVLHFASPASPIDYLRYPIQTLNVGPRGVYDEAKRYAEALTSAYRQSHDVDTAIVRIFNTFGPRMRPRDGRAIPTFIRQALAGEPITVAGDGEQTRSVCYVDDLVRGILALAESGHPGPMNIGNPQELTVGQIARDVVRACDSDSPITYVERPVDDPQVRRPDTTLAQEVLGWRPDVQWQEGLERTVRWFREQSAEVEVAEPVAVGQ
jgi:dTDP-glucose 4,6-dehydratase